MPCGESNLFFPLGARQEVEVVRRRHCRTRVEAVSAHPQHRRTNHRQHEVVRRDHVLALARTIAEHETADQLRNTELMCTAVRLAKSRMPALASQPVGSHTIWAIGE